VEKFCKEINSEETILLLQEEIADLVISGRTILMDGTRIETPLTAPIYGLSNEVFKIVDKLIQARKNMLEYFNNYKPSLRKEPLKK